MHRAVHPGTTPADRSGGAQWVQGAMEATEFLAACWILKVQRARSEGGDGRDASIGVMGQRLSFIVVNR